MNPKKVKLQIWVPADKADLIRELIKQEVAGTVKVKSDPVKLDPVAVSLDPQLDPVEPVEEDQSQIAMWQACYECCARDLKRVEAELASLRRWHETADMDSKSKRGWYLYYELKSGKARSEYDQEISG